MKREEKKKKIHKIINLKRLYLLRLNSFLICTRSTLNFICVLVLLLRTFYVIYFSLLLLLCTFLFIMSDNMTRQRLSKADGLRISQDADLHVVPLDSPGLLLPPCRSRVNQCASPVVKRTQEKTGAGNSTSDNTRNTAFSTVVTATVSEEGPGRFLSSSNPQNENPGFTCETCARVFTTKRGLGVHQTLKGHRKEMVDPEASGGRLPDGTETKGARGADTTKVTKSGLASTQTMTTDAQQCAATMKPTTALTVKRVSAKTKKQPEAMTVRSQLGNRDTNRAEASESGIQAMQEPPVEELGAASAASQPASSPTKTSPSPARVVAGRRTARRRAPTSCKPRAVEPERAIDCSDSPGEQLPSREVSSRGDEGTAATASNTHEVMTRSDSSSGGEGSPSVTDDDPLRECCRTARSTGGQRGLSLHQRRKHAEEYHAARLPVQRSKARWDREEVLVLAAAESDIIRAEGAVRNMNQRLLPKLGGRRTLEAIKRQRQGAEYKRLVQEYVSGNTSHGLDPITETLLDTVTSPLGQPSGAVREASRDDPIVVQSPMTAEALADPLSGMSSPNDRTSWEWKLDNALMSSISSFEGDPETIREIIRQARLGRALSNEYRQAVDDEFARFCSKHFQVKAKARAQNAPTVDRAPTASVNRNPRPMSGRQRRRLARRDEYWKVQNLFKSSRKNCAHTVLEGAWRVEKKTIPMRDQEAYWKELFGQKSKEDSRVPRPVGPELWALLEPVTADEVERILKSTQAGAPGPDGISVESVKKANCKVLAAHFNLWLYAGYPPSEFRKGETVLIPKVPGADRPEDHRPITLGSAVGRVYHRLLAARMEPLVPLSFRQKAFRHGDGLAENAFLLQSIVKDHTRSLKRLNLTFIDVRKAFDSVSQDSILLAAKRLGIPDRLLLYLRELYGNVTTTLRVGREKSAEITVGQGVRQGDPLSPLLFNAVIDWAVSELDARLGIKVGPFTVGYLAFADDIVLLTQNDAAMQAQLDRLARAFGRMGLSVNEKKSASLRIEVDGKRKMWVCNPGPYLSLEDKVIPALSVGQVYKYLGIGVNATGSKGAVTSAQEQLARGLDNITRAPLKPQQRMLLLVQFLLPSLYHKLVLSQVRGAELKRMDVAVRKRVKCWLHLPIYGTTNSYIYADVADGGLGVPCLQYSIPGMLRKRSDNVHASPDPVIQETVRSSQFFADLRRRAGNWSGDLRRDVLNTRNDVARYWRDQLYRSVDGAGLSQHGEVTGLHSWVRSGTGLLTGAGYVRCVQLRGNFLSTAVRRARGRQEADTRCDACGRVESLGHILQVCPRTQHERTTRHNRVLSYVANLLKRRGHEVVTEPGIPTPAGTRRPDLVVWGHGFAGVLDVTVASDNARLSQVHQDKVTYYDQPAIREYVAGLANVDPLEVQFSSVALNWRGALAKASERTLLLLGLTRRQLEIISVRTLEGGSDIYRAFRGSTWRKARRVRQTRG